MFFKSGVYIVIIIVFFWAVNGNREVTRDEDEENLFTISSSFEYPYNPAPPFIFPSVHFDDKSQTCLVKVDEQWMGTNHYPILYTGPYKDSILAFDDEANTFDPFKEPYPYHKFSFFHQGERGPSYPISFNLSIKVDTSCIVSYDPIFFGRGDLFQSHPVYLINIYTYPVIISVRRASFELILEAQDKNKVWRPIEKHLEMLDSYDENIAGLLPGHIAITTVPVFNGPFKTKLRLRLSGAIEESRPVFSNEFEGTINYTQFQEEVFPDESGG